MGNRSFRGRIFNKQCVKAPGAYDLLNGRFQPNEFGTCVPVADKLADEFVKLVQQSASTISQTPSDADWAQPQWLIAVWSQWGMPHCLLHVLVFFAVDINMQSERQETDEDSCVVQISKEP